MFTGKEDNIAGRLTVVVKQGNRAYPMRSVMSLQKRSK